ncbi:MAG: hypothetical protein Q4G09_08025 [Clostridia bacterium]|nr:hypothetical protein [Clostridia bacterium]
MDKKKILTYKDICKIKLTSEGFILYDEALNENIKVEEFEFKDNLGKKQISDRLFYMMGEGYVITAKNTEMRSYIKLDNFLDHLNIQYKDSSRLKF